MEKLKIDDEIRAELRKIAERLPQVPIKVNENNVVIQYVDPPKGFRGKRKKVFTKKDPKGIPQYCMMLGEAMIQHNIILQGNEKIDPKKKYYLEVGVVMVNHLVELEKAFIQDGTRGTSAYIAKINTQR